MNTAKTIDIACRSGGSVILIGTGGKIAGAQTHLGGEPAGNGMVWVNLLPGYKWRRVKLSDVSIQTDGISKGDVMVTKLHAVQEELPGVEQEKVPALERLIKKYQNFKLERMEATKLEVAAKEAVMEKMHELELTVYKRPGRFPFKATLKISSETLKVEEIDEDDEAADGEVSSGEGDALDDE